MRVASKFEAPVRACEVRPFALKYSLRLQGPLRTERDQRAFGRMKSVAVCVLWGAA